MTEPFDPILWPVLVLAAWTQIMFGWLAAARGAAAKRARIDLLATRGGRGADLEGRVPARANWPAHNYAHLHEQPTVFYAVALVLAVAKLGDGAALILAWAYVGFRIAHSLYQATTNIVRWRFLLFAGATLALWLLIGLAAIRLAGAA